MAENVISFSFKFSVLALEQVCFSVDMLRDHQNHKVMQSLTYGPIFLSTL